MVPHDKVLQALCIVASFRRDGEDYCRQVCDQLSLAFPVSFDAYRDSQVFPYCSATQAVLMIGRVWDDSAAWTLASSVAVAGGLGAFIQLTSNGLELRVSDVVRRWRRETSLRVFLDVCCMRGIEPGTIIADLKKVWGLDADATDVEQYRELFADPTYTVDGHWVLYERCISADEAIFKRRLLRQTPDYIRWALGVPVALSAKAVLERMVSDAYYTERLLKQEAGDHGTHLSKDTLTRLKLERETIFKGVDRLMKLEAREEESGDGAGGAHHWNEFLNRIKLVQTPTTAPLLSDLDDV